MTNQHYTRLELRHFRDQAPIVTVETVEDIIDQLLDTFHPILEPDSRLRPLEPKDGP